jgi:hypothetical protein
MEHRHVQVSASYTIGGRVMHWKISHQTLGILAGWDYFPCGDVTLSLSQNHLLNAYRVPATLLYGSLPFGSPQLRKGRGSITIK